MTLMPEDRKQQQEAMKFVSLNSLVVVESRNLGEVEFSDRGVVLGLRIRWQPPSEPPCQADEHLTGEEGFRLPTPV